jgi:hypothetical protein
MFIRRSAFILCASLLLCAPARVSAQASRGAHRHLRLADVRGEILPGVEIVPVTLEGGLVREGLARSRDGRFEAFTSYHAGQTPGYRLYFAERRAGKVYEVRGLPLAHRPFSDLVWVNDRTLAFDRWSQPHYGIHYAVDVRAKRLSVASAFPDELFLEQQRPKPRRKRLRR